MNVDLGIWDKLNRLVVFLLFIAGLMIVAVWYMPQIKQNERMRKVILRLDANIQKEDEIGRTLKAAADRAKRDAKGIERLARDRLGYAKTGEMVIRFESPVTNSVTR